MEGCSLRDDLTARQLRAWSFCALSVPAAMVLPGRGWLWSLGGSLAACGLAAAQQALQRRSGLGMRAAFACAFGQRAGRLLAAGELVWLLLAAAGAAGACQIAFEDDLGALAPAVPFLLASLACGKGRVAAGRVCGVLALCLAGLYAMIAAASLRHIQPAWCRPAGIPADAALALGMCLAPVCVSFVLEDGEAPRVSVGSCAAAALLPALPAFLTAACLSPALANTQRVPLLTLTKSLSVLSVMQRFELLLSVALMLGLFALLTACGCAAMHLAQAPGTDGGRKPAAGGFWLLAFAGSFLAGGIPMWFWTVGAAIFWGILPILTQVIVNIKNSKKR